MRKQKITTLLLAIATILMLVSLSFTASATSDNISWKGAMNYNDSNNYVTSIASIPAPNRAEMKWAYPLNDDVIAGGAYYAGQSVIVNGYLYATGGGKLHKVDIASGTGDIINDNAGSTISYYDYLCYADGLLILSTQDSIIAYSIDGEMLGSVSGTYGEYHPIQYHNGYVICNGFIYEIKEESGSIFFNQVGNTAIGEDAFNWSSGVFIDDLFYVASKATIYAVEYKTNTVVDSYVFDANRTASKNVQGGLCYDENTGRLFWGTYTYNSYIHSIALEDKQFAENSYMSEDCGQKSVATPIVYNGRLYLAGQQGRMCVHDVNDLSKIYEVTLGGGKVQGTPILSTADEQIRIYTQCSNGHLYMFTDNGDYGEAIKLAETKNYTKVAYPYAGFEQYAMDENGNIYCYNESGYLFCFGISSCEKPTITADLSTDRVKYGVDADTDALTVAATVSEGELSYQWQSSDDGDKFNDIAGATDASYTPPSNVEGTTYYRVVITNTVGIYTASETSSAAYIQVKALSNNTSVNAMVGKSNSVTATSNIAVPTVNEDGILYIENCNFDVKNIFLGVADEGSVSGVDFIYGAGNSAPKKYSVNNTDYTERYYKSTYTKPVVAKISILAEDGISEAEKYLIVSEQSAGKYITKASIGSDSEYFADNTISFTGMEQTASLVIIPQETVGKGEIYNPQWQWSSSDKKVAIVDSNGIVKCVGGGSAVITAVYDGVNASVNITSDAPEHSVHTYLQGECSVCGHKEPPAVNANFTMIDKNNNIAVSKDGITEIFKKQISVGDNDCDGIITLNDAFITAHAQHSYNGVSDFMTESSSYGPFITKLWGEQSSNVAYMVNDAISYSLLTELNQNDNITAYFYRDTESYSDIYTYIEGSTTITAGNKTEYILKGIVSSGEIFAKGATIEILDKQGSKISEATADDNGKFEVVVESAGEYILEAKGHASYIGKVWDTTINDYCSKEFESAPVVVSRFNLTALPYVETGGDNISSSDSITVYFTLLGDKKHGTPTGSADTHTKKKGNLETWIPKTKITLDKGSCVIDAVEKALKLEGIKYTNENNYISEIKGLAEFDNGSVSGWMYMLNGEYPTKAINEQKLSTGDTIILHYTDDYTAEKTGYSGGTSSRRPTGSKDDKTEKTPEENEYVFSDDTYSDVKSNDWYYEAVKYVYESNLMQGTDKGFEPNDNMTRAMLITVLWRLEDEPVVDYNMNFDDVKSDDWNTEAVRWAASENIIFGIGNNLFGTNDEITREQLTTILYRYAHKKSIAKEADINSSINHYKDSVKVSAYAFSAMEWAVDFGLIKGKTEATICPSDSATRAETATILMRFCEGILK